MCEIEPEKTLHELELNTLFQISGIIGQILELDHALESILAILSRSLSMERATVTLRDPHTGLLRFLKAEVSEKYNHFFAVTPIGDILYSSRQANFLYI